MRPNISTALAGGFGGMAPSVFQVGAVLVVGNSPTGSLLGRICGFLLYGFLGAGVALVHKERSLAKAFLLGVGLPALLQAGANGASRPNQALSPPPPSIESGGASAGFSLFAAPAYAQQPSQIPDPRAPTQLVLKSSDWSRELSAAALFGFHRKVQVQVRHLPAKDAELVFSSKDGKTQAIAPLYKFAGRPVAVPDFATDISIRVPSQALHSPTYKLGPPKSSQTFSLEVTDSFFGGFLQTLGVQSAQAVDLTLKELS